ncbi:hypothetical protein F3K39_19175 [Streptomyces sp. LBUM 1479]|uniref:hypothetical protein n=1 Tax=Streptomyces scabiei TaxID=1930 RepID=UPI001B315EEF|nr:hypothetical protein [Streptomyces sp. LBUM 1475]MBP5930189.1 hypothetical protein [Streptomyces sp. LBUM 1479]QTU63126.1 hypothetical protein F3K22_20775 [Streptomyces sp. LBUM 1475]
MFVYRNRNTGDVVRYEYRSARLDMLPNWELLEEPTATVEAPEVSTGPEPVQPTTEPLGSQEQGDVGTSPDEPPGGDGGDGDGPGAAERPARSASKADWQAYARARAQDSEEEAAIDDLTKDELIKRYGGDS